VSKRRGRSKLLSFPKEVLARVNEMLVEVGEGRKTYQEIADWLAQTGHETSVSAVGRYAKYFFALQKVKFVGEQAKTIIEAAGEDPLKIEEATAKLGAVVMMEVFQEAMQGDRIDVKHIGKLMGDFARLQMSSVARERVKTTVLDTIGKAVEKAAKKKHLDPETLRVIREEVYGLL